MRRAAPGRSQTDPHQAEARGGVTPAGAHYAGRFDPHVLDSAHGCSHGIKVRHKPGEGQQLELIAHPLTNRDVRPASAARRGLPSRGLSAGQQRLATTIAPRYSAEPAAFLDQVVPRFHRLRRQSLSTCRFTDLALQPDLSRRRGTYHETLTLGLFLSRHPSVAFRSRSAPRVAPVITPLMRQEGKCKRRYSDGRLRREPCKNKRQVQADNACGHRHQVEGR